MQTDYDPAARKGRLSLSINQDLLDRIEAYKQQVNFSALPASSKPWVS